MYADEWQPCQAITLAAPTGEIYHLPDGQQLIRVQAADTVSLWLAVTARPTDELSMALQAQHLLSQITEASTHVRALGSITFPVFQVWTMTGMILRDMYFDDPVRGRQTLYPSSQSIGLKLSERFTEPVVGAYLTPQLPPAETVIDHPFLAFATFGDTPLARCVIYVGDVHGWTNLP